MPISGIEFRVASTQQWVDASLRNPSDEDGLRLRGAGHDGTGYLTILYTNIPGNSWNQARLDNFTAVAQNYLDNRILRASLSATHPYIINGDPALEWLFWEGVDVIERFIVLENVTFANAQLNFTLRRFSRRTV